MNSGYAIAKWAHSRLVTLTRRKGFSYRDVEAEFLSRVQDGSLAQLPEVTEDARTQLLALGFGA